MIKVNLKINKEDFRKKLGVQDGKDGKDGKDAIVDHDRIIKEVTKKIVIPAPVEGKRGEKGEDGKSIDEKEVIKKVSKDVLKEVLKKIPDADTMNQVGYASGGANQLVYKANGTRLSDYVQNIDFTTGLSASYSNGTITVSGGSGDVVGPSSSVNNRVAFFNGTTGKLIKDSGLTLSGTNTGDNTFSTGLNNTAGTVTANISTGVSGGQTIIGGTAASDMLVITSTSNATKGTIDFGTMSAGENIRVMATRSAELAGTPINATNYQKNGAEWTISTGSLDKNADGLNSVQMLSAITLTIGRTYEVFITLSAASVSGPYFQLGGFDSSLNGGGAITTVGTPVPFRFVAATTASLFIKPFTFASRFTISAISIKEFDTTTGVSTFDGLATFRSPLLDAQGIKTLFFNAGSLFIINGGIVKNPTEALTIGNDGSIQLDHNGQIKGKLADTTTVVSTIYIDNSNIYHYTNEQASGGAIYGTTNASASGDVAIRNRGTYTIFIDHNTGNIGYFGNTSPTAYLHAKAGTTAANTSPFKFTMAGSAVMTTPESGAFETSTDNIYLTKKTAIRESIPGVLFTQTADASVSNTTNETSVVGSGTGTLTLPANFFAVGKTIRIIMSGVYSTVAVTGDTVTVKVKYGTTVIASQSTTSLLAGATNLFWWAEALVTCRSTGGSGSVQISGSVRYQVASSAVVENELNNSAGVTALDTTASGLLDVTVTHSAANASNTVKSLVASFEVLN